MGGSFLLTCHLEFVRKLAPSFVVNVSKDFGIVI